MTTPDQSNMPSPVETADSQTTKVCTPDQPAPTPRTDIPRYDLGGDCDGESGRCLAKMEQSKTGDWVTFEEYAALAAHAPAAPDHRELVKRLRGIAKDSDDLGLAPDEEQAITDAIVALSRTPDHADTDRLDWLEKHEADIYEVHGQWYLHLTEQDEVKGQPTARKAIDAVRKGTP